MNKKILLVGQAPLPTQLDLSKNKRISAPSIRAWHFAQALHEAGHTVAIASLSSNEDSDEHSPMALQTGLTLYAVRENKLNELEADFKPDAAIAVSAWPAYVASLRLKPDLPLWADFFGSPIAEGQAKAALAQDDSLLEPFLRFEKTVLSRADQMSAVSSYQTYATIGALALQGRLNSFTDGITLVHTLPATVDPQILPTAKDKLLRGKLVPQEAFIVLWSGGFNTWTDVDTLFLGLEKAMESCKQLHFVATGGALPPHDSQTYPHFQALIENSPNKSRYHLLGWLPYDNLHNYYLESDVGIILDRFSYEGMLGSRTRLLDWLLYGLPAIVTVTAELTENLVQEGLAFAFPHKDAEALADLLVELADEPNRLNEAVSRASEYVTTQFSYQKICQPLLNWANEPCLAPDRNGDYHVSELEKLLADYEAQIVAKNKQIASLENWAAGMEARLKQRDKGIVRRLKEFLGRI